jgi:hypothetical protein
MGFSLETATRRIWEGDEAIISKNHIFERNPRLGTIIKCLMAGRAYISAIGDCGNAVFDKPYLGDESLCSCRVNLHLLAHIHFIRENIYM